MKVTGHSLQFACFACRKCFKRLQVSGSMNRFMSSQQREGQQLEVEKFEAERTYKCPDCGGQTHFMGIDFKAPKKADIKAWCEAQAFIQSGKVFYRGSQS